ncbi:MAG: DoxX family protein [bacterium]
MPNFIHSLLKLQDQLLEFITPLFPLVLRFWIAKVFFLSGLTKIQSWSSTVALFEYEYTVPVLPPELAAFLATGVELIIPVLLVLGLLNRVSATVLFVFNAIAALSYPDISTAGTLEHMLWGLMLLVIMIYGPGKISLDHWLRGRFFPYS